MKRFKEIRPEDIDENFISLIGKRWMLITAGDGQKCNTMTASCGGAGVLWNKPVVYVFIRPQRYTREFVDANDRLTLSFLNEKHRKALAYCGAHSGRDEDKIKNAGLSVIFTSDGVPAIAEADLILKCKKLYQGTIKPEEFIERELIKRWYPENDLHNLYICEIEEVFKYG